MRRIPARFLLVGIRVYQVALAPLMPYGCKFEPSCSRYAAEAIAKHGALRGSRLAIGRILRCRPFTRGGHDPVPEPEDYNSHNHEATL
jgi:putative membrane protein insertion efficiency factor